MQACFWKQVKSPRAKILVSLCVAIGFTDIFSILEGVARDSPVSSLFLKCLTFYHGMLVSVVSACNISPLWPGFDSCCNGRQFKKGDNIYV
jgi:hypothetical protein